MIKNAGGAAFAGSLLSLPTPVTISEGGDATIKVWSQRQTDVTFKLEGTPDSELELSHSGSGWEELTYDFSNYTGDVDGITIIFDIDTAGQGGPDWTFYYDDIVLPTAESDPDDLS